MRTRDYLDGLTQLHRLADPEERRGVWRQSLATLGATIVNLQHPAPLEGLDPDDLLRSVERAREDKLLDDLDWLPGPFAAASLYEFAAALPPGDAKRDLGRLVFRRLHSGNASTFVALATRLALGRARVLSGPGVRARVALALDLPIGTGARADSLAYALISSTELRDEWLLRPAMGSLPSRRLAARLLERAAREAAQRAADGDASGVRVFRTPEVSAAWKRLLGDRESLVWRHVASARGLLSGSLPELEEQIHHNLSPSLSVTEWRRAAASLAASITVQPESALGACHRLLGSDLVAKDSGLPSALMLGLPRAAEREPEAVEELLELLVRDGSLPIAEVLLDLRRERLGEDFAAWAAQRARVQLREALAGDDREDEGKAALMIAVANELGERQVDAASSLPQMVADALGAFAEDGPVAAARMAQDILKATEERVTRLEDCDLGERVGRQTAFLALRELDAALLSTDGLVNLLVLQRRSESDSEADTRRTLGDLFQRLTNWLVIHEGEPLGPGEDATQFTLRIRRLQSFLHLVDADGQQVEPREHLLTARRVLTTRVLLTRLAHDHGKGLRRALCAASARAMDALVREEIAEISDVVIFAGDFATSAEDIRSISEASMMPEVERALDAYGALVRATETLDRGDRVLMAVEAIAKLATDLPVACSPRVEALRGSLNRLSRGLGTALRCDSLAELAERSSDTPLGDLEDYVVDLAQLVAGARRRLAMLDVDEPHSVATLRLMDVHVQRAIRTGGEALDDEAAAFVEAAQHDFPRAIADVLGATIRYIATLPADGPRSSRPSLLTATRKVVKMPAWMPPSRTLGGFYVTDTIGNGAGGSVFAAKRAGERHTARAELFALKVPDYSGAAARTLSEAEFLRLFREEAGALLALPDHPNIARFVTFDAGARPKPILVMELVEGPNIERLLETNDLTMARSLMLLEGVAAGLEAMHAIGVGHLDVKPSNIIVRQGELGEESPVLVDFGLAGRHMRPGCGTAEYGAPEVWGALPSDAATPVDVYAFCCMAFELVTNLCLFTADTELGMIGAHIEHDGVPEGVQMLTGFTETRRFARLLQAGLRRQPSQRASMAQIRAGLAEVRDELCTLPWPLVLAP
ncbi:MAG: protein kinase [Myxococcales bacterium]|nr:protein kinase [Myxococcales bacterium]MCB9629011.1 protein kinase [Sandaracinaceae bacterium]